MRLLGFFCISVLRLLTQRFDDAQKIGVVWYRTAQRFVSIGWVSSLKSRLGCQITGIEVLQMNHERLLTFGDLKALVRH